MITRSIATLLGSLALASAAHAAVVFSDDFSGYANTAAFTASSSYTFNRIDSGYTINLTGGLGGGTGLQLTSTGDRSFTITQAFDLQSGPATISFYFKRAGGTNVAIPQFGVINDSAVTFSSGTVRDAIATRLTGVDAATVRYQSGVATGASSGTFANPGSDITLVTGNWYFISATFTRLDNSGNFSISSSLVNSDSDGVLGTTVATYSSPTLSSTSLGSDGTLFAALRVNNNGLNMIDNLAVSNAVPEPSSFAALAGAGALAGAVGMRRRRR